MPVPNNSIRFTWIPILLAFMLMSCGDDFGTECTLPDNDVVKLACEGESSDDRETANASCVVENIIECDSRLCARYRGSNPFCTVSCSTDSDCPGGAFCSEFVIGTGRKYCVKESLEGS